MTEVVSEETSELVPAPLGHGFAHARFPTMQSGGPGVERHDRILWYGCAFGLLQIVFFTVLLAFGGRKDPLVLIADLESWRRHTKSLFSVRMFPGDHFFLHGSDRTPFLAAISEDLNRQLVCTIGEGV